MNEKISFEEERITAVLDWGTIKAELVYWLQALEKFELERYMNDNGAQEALCESIMLLRKALGLEEVAPGYGENVLQAREWVFERILKEASNNHALSTARKINAELKGWEWTCNGILSRELKSNLLKKTWTHHR